MNRSRLIAPLLRQLGGDPYGLGRAAQSAADPRYVVGPQREMIERAERRGASRSVAKVRAVRREKGSPATAPTALSAT